MKFHNLPIVQKFPYAFKYLIRNYNILRHSPPHISPQPSIPQSVLAHPPFSSLRNLLQSSIRDSHLLSTRRMFSDLLLRIKNGCDAQDRDFSKVSWERRFISRRTGERSPAIHDGRGVEECQIERLERTWCATATSRLMMASSSRLVSWGGFGMQGRRIVD